MPATLLFLDFGLIMLCGLVFYQDVRERAVSVVLFAGFFVLAAAKFWLAGAGFLPLLFNSLFIISQLLVVMLYCRLRLGSGNILKFMGAGDLICWGILALLFSPLNFVLFFVLSLTVSFILSGCLKWFQKSLCIGTVPLAGFQSLVLTGVLAFCRFNPSWQPYDDFSLLNLIGLV